MTDLQDLYSEYVDALNDSWEHKTHLLTDDRCFVEWVEERYPERLEEIL